MMTPESRGSAGKAQYIMIAGAMGTRDAQLDHLEHFRPGKPTPRQRFEEVPA